MRVLIGCEHSGIVREAFRAMGHEAFSCDLLPATDGSEFHIQCNLLEWLDQPLRQLRHSCQLLVCHPPCTFVCGSGLHWISRGRIESDGRPRAEHFEEAVQFALALWNCGVERVALENPIGALSRYIGKPSQIIQPYQFGDDASKATCLWLKGGLPQLVADPAQRVPGRIVNGRERWANQTDSGQNKLPPSDLRGHLRSLTYPGIAKAMAAQWGGNEQAELVA